MTPKTEPSLRANLKGDKDDKGNCEDEEDNDGDEEGEGGGG